MLERLRENQRITFDFHSPRCLPVRQTNIMGHNIFYAHVHTLGGGSLTLQNATKRACSDWANMLGAIPRIILLGHYHTANYVQIGDTEVFVNGSLVGGNSFSMGTLRCFTPPSQLMLGLNRNRITWRRVLDVRS